MSRKLFLLRSDKPLAAMLLTLVVTLLSGCSGRQESNSATSERAAPLSAQQILGKMFTVYRSAQTYRDEGVMRQQVVERGVERDLPPIPAALVFERPNLFVWRVFGAVVASDGSNLTAIVDSLSDQVLRIAAPAELTTDCIASDPLLREMITPERPELAAPQLDLLLSAEPQRAEMEGSQPPRLLSEAMSDGHLCYRVVIYNDAGRRVYWIDKSMFVLRRVDLPTGKLLASATAGSALSDIKIWIELHHAELNSRIDDAEFVVEQPPKARLVRQFVAPPPDPETSPLGKDVPAFAFQAVGDPPGGVLSTDDKNAADRILVLEFWSTTCQPCRRSFPALEKVYQEFRDEDRVTFAAVSVDPDDVTDATVQKTLRQWGATMPVVRDRQAAAPNVFGVQAVPTTILLGPKSRIHAHRVGAQPSYDDLANDVRRLLAGDDVAEKKLAALEQDYQKRLDAAAWDGIKGEMGSKVERRKAKVERVKRL